MAIFDHIHPKITGSNFGFPEFVPACKKPVYSICSFLRYSQFQSFLTRLATAIFDHVSTTKIPNIPSVSSSETVNFRVMSPDWPHPVLTLPSTKIFKHILICMNLYQHEKNHLIPSVHSSDRVNFGVHRSNWPHPFLTMPNQKICVNLHQHEKNEAVS